MSVDLRGPDLSYTNKKGHDAEKAVENLHRGYNNDVHSLLSWAAGLVVYIEDLRDATQGLIDINDDPQTDLGSDAWDLQVDHARTVLQKSAR